MLVSLLKYRQFRYRVTGVYFLARVWLTAQLLQFPCRLSLLAHLNAGVGLPKIISTRRRPRLQIKCDYFFIHFLLPHESYWSIFADLQAVTFSKALLIFREGSPCATQRRQEREERTGLAIVKVNNSSLFESIALLGLYMV